MTELVVREESGEAESKQTRGTHVEAGLKENRKTQPVLKGESFVKKCCWNWTKRLLLGESALVQSEALAFAGVWRECCAVVVMLRGESGGWN